MEQSHRNIISHHHSAVSITGLDGASAGKPVHPALLSEVIIMAIFPSTFLFVWVISCVIHEIKNKNPILKLFVEI